MSAIADAAQRIRALDPECSFIVQAPAGSGKTELLIQRYLTLLSTVDQPESVIAITYTRKAAGEMRRRVLEALRDARGPRPEAEHQALTWKLAGAALARSDARQWDLYSNPSRLRIRTIDSLSASLARQMPWVSRIGAPPEIVDDAEVMYRRAAQSAIELLEGSRWSEQVEALLLHLDNDYRLLQKLIAAMLARRDQWLRHAVNGGNFKAMRAALEGAIANLIEDTTARAIELAPAYLADEIARVCAAAGAYLKSYGRAGRALACIGLTALPGTHNLAAWLGIADTLLTKADQWRKSPRVTEGFPPTDKPLKKRCENILAALHGDGLFREALADLRRLPAPEYSDAQWRALQALLQLLPAAAAQLQLEFQRRGAADHSEIAMAAQRALGEPERPTDLALSLDYQIRHLLIDEFQDTSVSQYDLLEKLVAGWEPGDGRTIFAVGDPMQSIYRFREAVVGLFLKARQEGIGGVALESLVLSANFRSDEGIVRWVNETFPDVLPAAADITTGAIPFSPSVSVRPPKLDPAVVIHPFLGRDDEAEAEEVVRLVEAARERQAGKIAILVRARTHLPRIVAALRSAGQRFRAVEIDALNRVPAIQDLMALTRALLHPGDRIAWLAILRAPWCGMTLSGLHALAADSDATVWDLMHEEARLRRLEPGDGARLLRTRAVLETALAERAAGLRRRVEGAWIALGGPACASSGAELEDAGVFLDLLETLELGGSVDLQELERRVADLYGQPDSEAGDSLQVLTIHKAKGLEFDVVIIPGLGRKAAVDESRLMLWLERPRYGAEPDLLIAPIPGAGSKGDAMYDYLRLMEARKGELETGRLLYVAATRAKSELHLLGHVDVKQEGAAIEWKKPDASSLLCAMWSAAEPAFARAAAACPPAGLELETPARTPRAIRRLTLDWRLPSAPPEVAAPARAVVSAAPVEAVRFDWAGDTLRHAGTVVHQMMRRIAEDGLDQWTAGRIQEGRPAYRAALLALGVPAQAAEDAVDRVTEALLGALRDPRGRWVLGGGEASACEFPLCGVLDGRVVSARIDRTFIDAEGTRWIVDYKTSIHEGAGRDAFLDNECVRYAAQMQIYCQLFSAIENRPVRAALYFPLLGAWRELQASQAAGAEA